MSEPGKQSEVLKACVQKNFVFGSGVGFAIYADRRMSPF